MTKFLWWVTFVWAYKYTIVWRKGAANGKSDALSRRSDHLPPPLPSLPILSPTDPGPLLHTPYLIGAAVLLSPTDPLLPVIASAQAVKTLRSNGVYARRKSHSHNSKHSRLGKTSIGKVKVHELIGATIRMLLSSINTKNEQELSEHTRGTTQTRYNNS